MRPIRNTLIILSMAAAMALVPAESALAAGAFPMRKIAEAEPIPPNDPTLVQNAPQEGEAAPAEPGNETPGEAMEGSVQSEDTAPAEADTEIQNEDSGSKSAWLEEQKRELLKAMDLLRDYGFSPQLIVKNTRELVFGSPDENGDALDQHISALKDGVKEDLTNAGNDIADGISESINNAGEAIVSEVSDTTSGIAQNIAESTQDAVKKQTDGLVERLLKMLGDLFR